MAPPLEALERPIAVAGFMGAGKTTVGRLLAQRLGRPFADADAEVERRAGCSVRALFERDGEAAFRALEETVTRELAGARRRAGDRARRRCADIGRDARAACASGRSAPGSTCRSRPRGSGSEGAPGARPLAGDRQSFEQLGAQPRRPVHGRRGRDRRRRRCRPSDVAGALAQQVWTRPGLAQLALGLGAVAIVDDVLALPRTGAR